MRLSPHHATIALLAATTVTLAGCAELGLGDSTGVRAPNPRVLRITTLVTEHPTTDRWSVRWESSRPIAALRFRRVETRYRAATWQLGSGPNAWTTQGAAELIRATLGPLERVDVTFATDPRPRPGDYELNVTFSDGGRLLHTGQLDVEPLVCPDRATTRCSDDELRPWDGPVQRHWTLRSTVGRHLHVAGASGKGRLDWHQTDLSPVGTYAWFGTGPPVVTPTGTVVVDPGLPAWMIEDVRRVGPSVLAFYARATGVDHALPPTVYVSYGDAESERRGLGGGALGGHTLQLAARGSGWQERTPESRLRWLRFYAHEAFHLWQSGDRQAVYGPADDWLVEGGADYMALLALRETGTLDASLFERLSVRDANRCLITLEGEPLATASKSGRRDAVYSCGSTLHAIADLEIRDATEGRADIRHLYRQLWLRPADDRVRTSTYSFMAALHALTGDPTAPGPIGHLVHSGQAEQADIWMQARFVDAGLSVELAPARAVDLDPDDFLRPLARVLSRCDCNHHPQAASMRDGDLVFRPSDRCNLFRNGYRVAEVETFHPGDNPIEAYLAVSDGVDSHRRVEISAEQGGPTARLRCPPAALDRSWSRLLRLSE